MIRTPSARFSAFLFLGVYLAAAPAAAAPVPRLSVAAAPKCASLEWPGAGHWLSAPFSRLVLNPSSEIVNPAGKPRRCSSEGGISDLRANVAYYVGARPVRLPSLWMWEAGGSGALRRTAPPLDLSGGANLPTEGVLARTTPGGLRVIVAPGRTWGAVNLSVSVNLDQTPWLLVSAANSDASWTLKVISDTEKEDIPIAAERTGAGSALINLPAATDWRGQKNFRIRLFAIGKPGEGVTFRSVRFGGFADPAQSVRVIESGWYPQKLVCQAAAERPKLSVVTTTGFDAPAAICQLLKVTPRSQNGSAALTLTGHFDEGVVRWDARRRVIILQAKDYFVTIGVSRPARWLGVYSTWNDWLNKAPSPHARSGVWGLEFSNIRAGDAIALAAYFTPGQNGIAHAERLAARLAGVNAFYAAMNRQRMAWDHWLARAPRPDDFLLRTLPALGTTPREMRGTYYRAWAFLLQNILPPMPETGFRYPQVAAGKPSLWSEGDPRAPASSQWESYIGIQDLAFIDPTTAWQALAGMMSLVAPDGSMAGEGLPARHCQAAWGLYTRTGDRAKLRALYPALKRLLVWKFEWPQWIHHNIPDPNSKSAEFVCHALMDSVYARRIAKALGMPDEAKFWDREQAIYGADYAKWFWAEPGGPPFFEYQTDTGKRSSPNSSWALEGMDLPPNILHPEEQRSLFKLFHAMFRTERPFILPNFTREPAYSSAMRGAWEYGEPEKTAILAESAMRDITGAGEFAEVYEQTSPPGYGGVTPSLFGALLMIHATLWHNGLIPDDGFPILVSLPLESGGATIPIGSTIVSYRFNAGRTLIWGPGLDQLRIPAGFKVAPMPGIGTAWSGSMPVGKQTALVARAVATANVSKAKN